MLPAGRIRTAPLVSILRFYTPLHTNAHTGNFYRRVAGVSVIQYPEADISLPEQNINAFGMLFYSCWSAVSSIIFYRGGVAYYNPPATILIGTFQTIQLSMFKQVLEHRTP